LLSGECDIALAGGVAVKVPHKAGYFYQEGGILSPDGHCRPFDAQAQGTVAGNGAGVVVLKRLEDALAGDDTIVAVIRATAINNDGSLKVGYTAPSVDGQAAVIRMAQAMAGVDPATITYVEAHGTGTVLGDPIEIAALSQVFAAQTTRKGYCALGSVKSNLGHLDTAAGIAGLLKTALALQHRAIPPSLNFQQPNPSIDFADTPFYVNQKLAAWKVNGIPRRAAVSSFGIGGTNAHAILEEAPPGEPSGTSRPWQLLLLSARSETALSTITANLAEHLRHNPELPLADVAYTLKMGRKRFDHRRVLLCRDHSDLLELMEKGDPERALGGCQNSAERQVVFLFPGQGAQYADMGRAPYETEPIFREQVDACARLLLPHLGCDLRELLYPAPGEAEAAGQRLAQTAVTQPALFTIEYALATLWQQWGLEPRAMIGHSIGEYVAACLAGVFSLEDALALVAARGRLMQQLPGGSMLSVPLAEEAVLSLLGSERPLNRALSLAAVNGAALCVVSGPNEAIDEWAGLLAEMGVESRRLHTSHAFHSAMMDPILEPFREQVSRLRLRPPQIPFLSNVTGDWIRPEEATDPGYWATHLRQTVRFAGGLARLLAQPEQALLEVGPGRTLTTLARMHPARQPDQVVVSSLPPATGNSADSPSLPAAVGRLWLAGAQINWTAYYRNEKRRRIPLPTYPFERQRYWLEQTTPGRRETEPAPDPVARQPLTGWFYRAAWESTPPTPSFTPESGGRWLILSDGHELGPALAQRLQVANQEVVTAIAGQEYRQQDELTFAINPGQQRDYDSLLAALASAGRLPDHVVHLWMLAGPEAEISFAEQQERGFYSLVYLAQALERHGRQTTCRIFLVSNQLQDVSGVERLCPGKATVLGPVLVMPQENAQVTCHNLDIVWPQPGSRAKSRLLNQLLAELATSSADRIVAYRGSQRWRRAFQPVRLDETAAAGSPLREGGVYLLTGSLEGSGWHVANYLARTVRARLALIESPAFPPPESWEGWLAAHGEENRTGRKIRRAQALAAGAGGLLVYCVDPADAGALAQSVRQTVTEFGGLHGVIHAAGVAGPDVFRPLQEITEADCRPLFAAKIHRLLALAQALPAEGVDFCLLHTSLSTHIGGLGFAILAALDSFLEAFAHQQNLTSPFPWVTIGWDMWQTGEAEAGPAGERNRAAIAPEEGIEALRRILGATALSHFLVSTWNLEARWRQAWQNPATDVKEAPGNRAAPRHQRPALANAYVAPRNEPEQVISEIWQELLGVAQVGVYDNFFELGGHSLLVTQVVSRLRELFPFEIPLSQVFEVQTVADLALLIVQEMAALQESEAMAAILAEIEQLPADEVIAHLART
jgi:acyl transferase domain-containing protein